MTASTWWLPPRVKRYWVSQLSTTGPNPSWCVPDNCVWLRRWGSALPYLLYEVWSWYGAVHPPEQQRDPRVDQSEWLHPVPWCGSEPLRWLLHVRSCLVRLFDFRPDQELFSRGHTKRVVSLNVNRSDLTFISGSEDRTVRLWDLRARLRIGRIDVETSQPVTALDHQGIVFAVLDHMGMLKMFSTRNYSRPFETYHIDCKLRNINFGLHGSFKILFSSGIWG